ncbi:hypothetical protein NAT51_10050 [Flavobacterium amniphilum]|uniref:hypothetical protein n=1 Tax=Flavobacterium amniphilum TaxID=1834035 RepID=UPI00202A332D|nr:hypothetical protein [Flavobacterium amniphilum]MCL9805865.1 hypothetical protein [Flavobacterium amniphilum]
MITTLVNIEKLILTIKINDRVIDGSTILDEKTKEAFKNLSKYTRDSLEKETKMNSYGLKCLENGILTYWNESINPDTEKFWAELKNNGIDYQRKEPLRLALNKNRFRRVDQGMDARKHWTELKKLKEINENYTSKEIEQIDNIIKEDEKRRLDILKKCLAKNEIPQTQYLKFGECMTYMGNCDLWEKNFSKEEVEELYLIWKNFKSK